MKRMTKRMVGLAGAMSIVVGGCGLDSKNIVLPIVLILIGMALDFAAICMHALGW